MRDRERRGLVRRVDGSLPRTGPDYYERKEQQKRQKRKWVSPEEADLVLSLLPAHLDELVDVLELPKGKVAAALRILRDGGDAVYAYGSRKWMTREQFNKTVPARAGRDT